MHLSTAMLLLLTVLATARGTILMVDDAIAQPFRTWVVNHRPDHGDDGPTDKVVYFVHCPWCTSMWIGVGLAALARWFGQSWPVQLLLIGMTASLAAGLIGQAKGRI